MYLRIIDTAAHTLMAAPKKVLVTVNAGFTGTLTIQDGGSTVAVLTNPTMGQRFEYWDLAGNLIVTCSAIGDITVSAAANYGTH